MSSTSYRLAALDLWIDSDAPGNVSAERRPISHTGGGDFDSALLHYRVALEAVARDAVGMAEQEILRLLLDGLELIEQRYAETRDPKWCWVYIESEQVFYDVNILRGEGVPALRAAFQRMSQLVIQRLTAPPCPPSDKR